MEKLKKRTKGLVCIGLIILVLFGVVEVVNLPEVHVEEETIKRNLAWMILQMDEEPVGRTVAWDSELPAFVQRDLEYAEKHGYEIEYEFKGNVMRIEKQEGEWQLGLVMRRETGYTCVTFTNFSMYQTKDHAIVVYGTYMGQWFQKITLQKNYGIIDTIT